MRNLSEIGARPAGHCENAQLREFQIEFTRRLGDPQFAQTVPKDYPRLQNHCTAKSPDTEVVKNWLIEDYI